MKINVKQERIFQWVDLVLRDVSEGKDVFSIASDSFGCLTKQQHTIGRSYIKLESLFGKIQDTPLALNSIPFISSL